MDTLDKAKEDASKLMANIKPLIEYHVLTGIKVMAAEKENPNIPEKIAELNKLLFETEGYIIQELRTFGNNF